MPWNIFPTKRPTFSKATLDMLILFLLILLFYGRPYLEFYRTSYGGDSLSLFVPAAYHYAHALYEGRIPLWDSYNWLGSPFLASFQSAVLYPPRLIELAMPTPWAGINVSIFLSLLWLTWGAYFFGLRALELEQSPALLMGIGMGCCGFVGGHTDHVNQLAAISWIPWVITEALLVVRRHPL
ncbi:TPA: hypothetical protein DDW35_02150, partial [Candidatus Sumerlaeota bacterium]|nr:hypothetical protein [Candidatus Sumerlaeota bacterium]